MAQSEHCVTCMMGSELRHSGCLALQTLEVRPDGALNTLMEL